jgi:4-amino-4-deoxy-L-arabinose transferase-like glycosyltransferase
VLAPLVALHASVNVLRLVGPISLLVAGVFFWLFLRNIVSRGVALAGGVVLAVFPPFLPLMPHIRSEPVALMFLMAALWALGQAHRSGKKRWALASGLLAGLMVLTRVEDGYVLLAGVLACLVVYTVRRKRTDLLNLICVGAALAVCVPWLAYTESLTHKFPYWASSGGMSLYLMASPTAGNTGSWVNPQIIATDPHWLPDRPLFQRLSNVRQVPADSQFQTIALRLIRHHPGVYLEHVADNLSRMVIGTPYSFESAGKGVYFYGIADVILLIALVIAIVVIRRGGSPGLPSALRVLAIFAVLNFVLHLAVAAYPRMTTLSIPAALGVVALGLEELVRRRPDAARSDLAAPESA